MTESSHNDAWSAGASYDQYMGRWSGVIAQVFLDWLEVPPGLDWLDIGCGTGALSAAIVERRAPRSLLGVDPSPSFVEHARTSVVHPAASFSAGDAAKLPLPDHSVDVVTSALAYNFFPDRLGALTEMQRVARPGATIPFYVWDYPGGGLGFVDAFWKAAAAVDPAAAELDERMR